MTFLETAIDTPLIEEYFVHTLATLMFNGTLATQLPPGIQTDEPVCECLCSQEHNITKPPKDAKGRGPEHHGIGNDTIQRCDFSVLPTLSLFP